MTAGDQADRKQARDYLWDGSGEPDAEMQKLETLLGEFRHSGRPLVLPPTPAKEWTSWFRIGWIPRLAVAAAVVVFVALGLWWHGSRAVPAAWSGWNVTRVAGTPRLGANTIEGTSKLGTGELLETDAQSRAHMMALETGEIEVDPGTRLRMMGTKTDFKRLSLDRGTIHAWIWAPPGKFVVDTPSALAVDLGCAYTLHVDDSGAGLLRTSRGWVGFRANGHESFIPAGAACATRPGKGPGIPYLEDAPENLRAALERFDFGDTTALDRSKDLDAVLSLVRKEDALTLWHLLSRVDESQRGIVYDRLSTLAPAPKDVTREGILRLDQRMLDRWWNELGYDDIAVWRHWERQWKD